MKKLMILLFILIFIGGCEDSEIENNSIISNESTPVETINETNQSEERIVLSLNFDNSNMPNGLTPMGETITHDIKTNPRGHEGIDFQWDKKVPIYAFADGTVVAIERSEGHTDSVIYDVGVKTGKYLNSYTELEDYNRNLTVGEVIKQGEFIGYPWHPTGTHEGYRMIHWNFGYWFDSGKNIYPERICPLTYFDNESLAEIQNIWKIASWDHRDEFPLICNGPFENLDK